MEATRGPRSSTVDHGQARSLARREQAGHLSPAHRYAKDVNCAGTVELGVPTRTWWPLTTPGVTPTFTFGYSISGFGSAYPDTLFSLTEATAFFWEKAMSAYVAGRSDNGVDFSFGTDLQA